MTTATSNRDVDIAFQTGPFVVGGCVLLLCSLVTMFAPRTIRPGQ